MRTKKKTLIEVDSFELEEAIQKHFGRDYELIPMQEWGNDQEHAITVDGTLDDYNTEKVEAFKNLTEPGMFLLRSLMNSMAADGVIEKGEYLVTVCW